MLKNKTSTSKKTIKRLLEYAKYSSQLYPHIVAIQFWSSIVSTASIFVNIFFIGQIINMLLKNGVDFQRPVMTTIYLLLSLLVLNFVSEYLSIMAQSGSHLILKNANKKMAEKLLCIDYSSFINPNFRKLYSSVKTGFMYTGGFTIFISTILNGLVSFITTIIIAGGSLIVMISSTGANDNHITAFVNSPLFIFTIIILVLLPIFSSTPIAKAEGRVMKKFFAFNIQFNRLFDYYNEILFREPIFGKTLRMYDDEGKTLADARKNVYKQLKVDTDYQVKATQIAGFNSIITYAMVGFLYLLISMKSATGAIALGSVVIYVGYLQQVMATLSSITGAWGNREASFTTMDQYIKFMRFRDDNNQFGNQNLPDASHGYKIEFKDVTYKYPGSQKNALDHINITINAGERLALVGLNGSGKTTLIKLLIRLLVPTKGSIRINGVDINDLNSEEYRQLFSVVFQDFSLSAFSIDENVSAAQIVDTKRAEHSMKLAGVWDKVSSLDHKGSTSIGTKIDKEGVQLSGGEMQKIAIARAWYKDAPIVILDEPTSALDAISEAEIYEHFNELVAGKTAIYISHRMSSTKFSSRILVLNEGKIVENGTHDELMTNDGLYHQLYSEQAKYYSQGDTD
ncbi:multidrug ABC transporter permease [Furfurilactobacillus rossiae]|uniref:ABC transporter ATP-binding protein n=1 Tax=Furfurilactobacillus rossiae TaxID=231049 RepID=UPI0015BA0CB6|nr:ABC transporter ATP-binding protein [Furfurilactobacillus rossiae]MCF6166314.1 ABC transporter ATP-binding protein/permease [Furfurilactobacillus rossiae]QLE65119.1 multidrug ABC transporter permease [Furfurilactobacillus rossiae]